MCHLTFTVILALFYFLSVHIYSYHPYKLSYKMEYIIFWFLKFHMCPYFPLIIIMAQVTPQPSGSVEVTIYLSFKKSELSAFSKALCTNNDLEAMLMIFLVLSPLIYSNVQGRSTNWIFGNNCDCCGLHDSYCFLSISYCIYDHEILCGYGNHRPLHSGFRYW